MSAVGGQRDDGNRSVIDYVVIICLFNPPVFDLKELLQHFLSHFHI